MKNKAKLSAVILSAGYSSRMGAFKPLLEFQGKTALELIVDTFRLCGIDDIVVVVGCRAEEIMKKLNYLHVNWAVNENYSDGMYSSVKTGVRKLKDDSQGFFLNPVDIPIIKKATIEDLKAEFLKGEKGIIYPVFKGEKIHPPIISHTYAEYILEDNSPYGLGNLLKQYEEDSKEITVVDWGASKDMDTKEDYEELKEYYSLRYIPNDEECRAIWSRCSLPHKIIEHCKTVSSVACSIGKMLRDKGYSIDLNKIKYAALLHDIGRLEANHAEAGARILEQLGYRELADIVYVHMDMSPDIRSSEDITEKEIVYLADKCVSGNKIISLDERLKKTMEEYGDDTEAVNNIKLRFEDCRVIIHKIEKITGECFSI